MGQELRRRPIDSAGFNTVLPRTSTAAIIANRVVKILASGNIIHTTGSSGRLAHGVALAGCTASGKGVPVQLTGVVTVVASSRAIANGAPLRATSGSASTATFLGGTVRAATVAMTTALPIRANIVGVALSSCAAGATKRTIQMLMALTVNNPALT
jgi:hypothetical protein